MNTKVNIFDGIRGETVLTKDKSHPFVKKFNNLLLQIVLKVKT